MTAISALIQRKPLLWTALFLVLVKSIQLAIDSKALFYFDSGAYLINALGVAFVAERSYLYGWLIRFVALPFHSLRAIVVMQVAIGALTAWLLALVLTRYLKTREWIAIAAALVFAFDPVQIVHEHLILSENTTLLVAATYLVAALGYLEKPAPWKLSLLAFLGTALVGLRMVYFPVVMASAVLLPLLVRLTTRRMLAFALAVSCGSTALLHLGYRHLTGHLAGREPAYHYITGFILAAGTAPLFRPEDIDDPRVAAAVAEQNKSVLPLWDRDRRGDLLFAPEGFSVRLIAQFHGDHKAANMAAQLLARRAILRNPFGFLRLGLHNYYRYWQGIPTLRWSLPWENGSPPRSEVQSADLQLIRTAFGADVSNDYLVQTPTRRYHIFGRYWCVFLLLSPYLGGLAAFVTRRDRTGVMFLFAWSGLLLASMCIGGIEHCYRYLHPFSFTGLAAVAVLLDLKMQTRRDGTTAPRQTEGPAAMVPASAARAALPPAGMR
ncbi:MAG TPA: hypothetical protein VGL72_27655 [Bryobacteraceae bacterium]|jgi:hypothetical protein